MAAFLLFFAHNEIVVFTGIGLLITYSLFHLWRNYNQYRAAIFGLEREITFRNLNYYVRLSVLAVFFFSAEFILATFISPSLPAFLATPTVDLLATSTLSAQSTPNGTQAQIVLTSPRPSQQIQKSVELIGTVNIPNLGFYKFEVAPLNSESWTTIFAGSIPMVNGKFGDWDTSELTPGDYQIRLFVTDNQGNALPACVIPVRILP
jgi:hypothetical protein